MDFQAGGNVNIDLAGLVNNSELRLKMEETVAKKEHLTKTDGTKVPEQFFSQDLTPKELLQLQLDRPWTGPGGLQEPGDTSWAGRTKRRLHTVNLLDPNPGALVATVDASAAAQPSADSPLFYVGERNQWTALKDGSLRFTVNDVQYPESSQTLSDLFYRDNVGFYWVKIVLSSNACK